MVLENPLDFVHKKTLKLVAKYQTIFVGNFSGKFLRALGMGFASALFIERQEIHEPGSVTSPSECD